MSKRKYNKSNLSKLYDIILDNPGLNGMELSKASGISTDQIYYVLNNMVKNGALLKYKVQMPNSRYTYRYTNKFENKYYASETRIR